MAGRAVHRQILPVARRTRTWPGCGVLHVKQSSKKIMLVHDVNRKRQLRADLDTAFTTAFEQYHEHVPSVEPYRSPTALTGGHRRANCEPVRRMHPDICQESLTWSTSRRASISIVPERASQACCGLSSSTSSPRRRPCHDRQAIAVVRACRSGLLHGEAASNEWRDFRRTR